MTSVLSPLRLLTTDSSQRHKFHLKTKGKKIAKRHTNLLTIDLSTIKAINVLLTFLEIN